VGKVAALEKGSESMALFKKIMESDDKTKTKLIQKNREKITEMERIRLLLGE
jgi:hypothetical protein